MTFAERIATSEGNRGRRIPVEVATHVAGTLDFKAGPVGTIITSFDIWAANLPRIEVYGTEGSLSVPDPNRFGGPVKLRRGGSSEWIDIPLVYSDQVGRGIGVADMAYAVRHGRPQRASGELAYHALDVMCAFEESSVRGEHIETTSAPPRPAPLPLGLLEGVLDAGFTP
jgi:predicted dehydrogenase